MREPWGCERAGTVWPDTTQTNDNKTNRNTGTEPARLSYNWPFIESGKKRFVFGIVGPWVPFNAAPSWTIIYYSSYMKKAFCNGWYLSHLWNVRCPSQLEMKSQVCKKKKKRLSHMKYFNKNINCGLCLKAHSLFLLYPWDGAMIRSLLWSWTWFLYSRMTSGSLSSWFSCGVLGLQECPVTYSLVLKPKSSAELFEEVWKLGQCGSV